MSALMRNPRLRAKMSVLQQPEAASPDFAEQVADILAMIDGSYRIAYQDGSRRARHAGGAIRP